MLVRKNLKFNVFSTLLVIIVPSVVLTMFVIVMFWQRDAVRHLEQSGEQLMHLMVSDRPYSSLYKNELQPTCGDLQRSISGDVSGVIGVTSDSQCSSGLSEEMKSTVLPMLENAFSKPVSRTYFFGSTWAVFFPGKKYMFLTKPVLEEGQVRAVVGVITPLKPLYRKIQNELKLIFGFLLINILILILLGFIRFHNIIVRPIQNLVKRADSYEEDGFPFLTLGSKGDLGQLNDSLGQMFDRIEADKNRLELAVSNLEKVNVELLATRKEMVRTEKLSSIGRLSSGLAHEIGNPIGIVLGYLGLLRGHVAVEEREDFIDRSEQELERVGVLLRQLLDLSREVTVEKELVSVHEVLKNVAELLQPQPFFKKITSDFHFDAGRDIISGCSNHLQQIFINILMNAVDAIHERSLEEKVDGQICISTSNVIKPEASYIYIVISDNGIGVKAENIDNVFDPFFTTKEPGKGTGLGLSVSFAHVSSMDGKMEIVSNNNGGAKVSISFPVD